MNVLLINTNRCRQPVPVMPLGACMVADAAVKAGHDVRFLDLMFEKDPLSSLRKTLKGPVDAVGISVRNIDNNNSAKPAVYLDDLRPLVKTIREQTAAKIVLGGAAVRIMPAELLAFSGADLAVTGPGETIFPEILKGKKRLPGTAWIENGRICSAEPGEDRSVPPPCPDLARWIDVRSYLPLFASVPLQAKRGCPFSCIYCTYPVSEGRNYRLCPPRSVAGTIERYAAQGVRDIEFVDNVFNAPYYHALEVCEAVARRRTTVRLHTADLSPKCIDDRLLDAMERAGFAGIGVTADSASDAVLQGLRKPFDRQTLFDALAAVRRHHLPCLWVFLLGGPGETSATLEETLQFAGAAVRPGDAAFFNSGIRIYPGTGIEALARETGQLTIGPSMMLDPVNYFSPQAPKERIAATLKAAVKLHPNFIMSDDLNVPHLDLVYRGGYWMGMRNPVWRYAGIVRKSLKMAGVNI